MKKLLPILLLLASVYASAGTCGNGYGLSVGIRLQRAIGADQTNFPYPLVGTYPPLRTVANGGQITHTAANAISVTGPADLVFCDAASSGNALKYEVAYYNAVSGNFEIWVQMPTLHTASNDVIYMFIGNNSVSTTQQDLSLWSDASFVAVYHLADGSTLSAKDSTNTFNGTINSATATTGQIDGAAAFVAGSSQSITSSLWSNATTNITMEAWYKWNGVNQSADIISSGNGVANGYALIVGDTSCASAGTVTAIAGGATCNLAGSVSLTPGWQYITATRGASNWNLYRNGVSSGTSNTNSPITPTVGSAIGKDPGGSTYLTGSVDEVRFSTVARTQNWIQTTYNTEAFPSYQIIGQSFSVPTIVNYISCGTNVQNASATCTLPLPVVNGNLLVVAVSNDGSDCASAVSDSKGFTFTKQVEAIDNTTITSFVCIFTAPVTSAGVDTVSIFGTAGTNIGTWAYVYEVEAATTTGISTNSSVNDQPTTTTATAPNNNSILFCATLGQATTTTPNTYSLDTVLSPTRAGFGFSFLSVARGLVSSGSNSCSFDSGHGGALMILGDSPTTSKKRRSQVY